MPIVYNPLPHKVRAQALGNWFEFPAGSTKSMNENIANFLCRDKAYLGFVSLSDIQVDAPTSEEAKAEKEAAKKLGISNAINHNKKIVHNLEVSLQRDLDMANIKTSAKVFASDGELEAYKRLIEYSAVMEDEGQKRAEEIEKLKKDLDGSIK